MIDRLKELMTASSFARQADSFELDNDNGESSTEEESEGSVVADGDARGTDLESQARKKKKKAKAKPSKRDLVVKAQRKAENEISAAQEGLFSSLDRLRASIEQIDELVKQVERMHKEALTSVNAKQTHDLKAKIGEHKHKIGALFANSRAELKRIEAEYSDAHAKEMGVDRIARTQCYYHLVRLQEISAAWHQIEVSSRCKYDDLLRRQYLIINPEASTEDLKSLSQADFSTMSQEMFSVGHVEQRLADLKARQEEMRHIEEGLVQIQELMQQIALLVAQQGEGIDRLEDYVERTEQYVERAVRSIKKGIKQQKRNRKLKMILFILILLVAMLGLAVLGMYIPTGIIWDIVSWPFIMLWKLVTWMVAGIWAGIKWLFSSSDPPT